LCRRGGKFIVDYEIDLKDYEEHLVRFFRPTLTSFKGPVLMVGKKDEVVRFSDPSIYDNRGSDEGDIYIYLWHLRCDQTSRKPKRSD
jgi:hypothetical protein